MHISKQRQIEGEKTREDIYRYLVENPASKPMDIANHFDVSQATVSRHLKAIRDGWRPEDEGQSNA